MAFTRGYTPSDLGESSLGPKVTLPPPHGTVSPIPFQATTPFKRPRTSTLSDRQKIGRGFGKDLPSLISADTIWSNYSKDPIEPGSGLFGGGVPHRPEGEIQMDHALVYMADKIIRHFNSITGYLAKDILDLHETISTLHRKIESFESLPSAPPPPLNPAAAPFQAATTAPIVPSSLTLNPLPKVQSWAQVVKKGKKKAPTKPASVPTPPSTKSPPQKKPTTIRERRIIIKRDGTPLTNTPLQIRDSLNQALGSVMVQTVTVSRISVDLIVMEPFKAASVISKLGPHLSLVPGAAALQLDTMQSDIIIHGIPTSVPLDILAQELVAYNPGLMLASTPRWLTTPDQRQLKKASSAVITITGNKSHELAQRSRLAALSSTFRIERRLRFGPSTQCGKCQRFGHHTNRCSASARCRWCAAPHHTGLHSCPSLTCAKKGSPCSHTIVKCVNCHGPHESHHQQCTERPSSSSKNGDDMEVNP